MHHRHIRKRSKSLEPFPARTAGMRLLDAVVTAVGVLGPILTLPQTFKIYIGHDASGVSLITWGAYVAFSLPWILYGYMHRERPIVITYILWLIVDSSVFIGALIYGGGGM